MAAKETVNAAVVLDEVKGRTGNELSGPQRAALKLAVATLILIAACSLLLVGVMLYQIRRRHLSQGSSPQTPWIYTRSRSPATRIAQRVH